MLYSNTILSRVFNGTTFSARKASILLALIGVFASTIGIAFVRYAKRRPLMLGGYMIIAFCHAMVGTLTILGDDILLLGFLCLFICVYGASVGPMAWIYATEVCTDVALGTSIFTMMLVIVLLSVATEPLMNSELH